MAHEAHKKAAEHHDVEPLRFHIYTLSSRVLKT